MKFKVNLRAIRGLLLLLVLIGIIAAWVTVSFHDGEPYEYASQFVSTDERVIGITGRPHKVSLCLTRPFRSVVGERSGEASMTLVSTSPTGEFTIGLVLLKANGQWEVRRAQLSRGASSPIVLVDKPVQPACC